MTLATNEAIEQLIELIHDNLLLKSVAEEKFSVLDTKLDKVDSALSLVAYVDKDSEGVNTLFLANDVGSSLQVSNGTLYIDLGA